MRAKNASDIAISDNGSILRGVRSPIHSFENVLNGASLVAAAKSGLPSTKRKSYWFTHAAGLFGNGRSCSNGGAVGNGAGWCSHDGRRSANTAVAKVATSAPPCVSSTHQCCVERLAL